MSKSCKRFERNRFDDEKYEIKPKQAGGKISHKYRGDNLEVDNAEFFDDDADMIKYEHFIKKW